MAPAAAAASPEGEGHDDARLQQRPARPYGAARRNSSTASSTTSTGHPIEVTFYTARPPVLAHFNVHCPGLQLPPDDLNLMPRAIASDVDLFLFRVPTDPMASLSHHRNDYFVYRAHPQHPKLDLLPKSYACFGDCELAVLGYCAADGGDKQYVVAGLKTALTLHIYRSRPGGEAGSWTSSDQPLPVEELLRDKVCPIPRDADLILDHMTTKVIVIGGPKGTVGWVDLWRGVFFCDVLDESPKLRDLPLPLPAKGNWRLFRNDCSYYRRDIAVSQDKNSIKHVEMEIVQPREVATTPSGPEPATYLEWLHRRENPPRPTYSWVPGRWKATVWSIPIPAASWEDWHLDCTAKSGDLRVDDPRHYQLLHKLMISGSSNKEVTAEATLSLGLLGMAYPTLSIDGDDVIYLPGKGGSGDCCNDMRRKKLEGVAKLDSQKNTIFMRCFLASGISKHLMTTGTYHTAPRNLA
uniref:DUF1618 domain-containing protein n=1 Tax=Setaria viridis TaxID=4556 RepID=A0A4U6T1X6_SETVI|nr:LOW QUALITY PROTEIN: hypothetical protein SEVIR_9G372500v2 [Setaria viridis]